MRLQKQVESLLGIQNQPVKNMPENFDDAHRLFSIQFEKKAKNENHIKLFQTHISNNTVYPKALWCYFPEPFLPCDPYYIEEYNKLILTFQTDANKLGIKCCQNRVKDNIATIEKYKTAYTNVDNLEQKLENIQISANKKLETDFKESSEKISRYHSQKLLVVAHPNKPNASFNNQYNNDKRVRSNTSTPNKPSQRYKNSNYNDSGSENSSINSNNYHRSNNNSRNYTPSFTNNRSNNRGNNRGNYRGNNQGNNRGSKRSNNGNNNRGKNHGNNQSNNQNNYRDNNDTKNQYNNRDSRDTNDNRGVNFNLNDSFNG